MTNEPQVTLRRMFSMQVCVPETWTDAQVRQWAEQENSCGTENGWKIRKKGDPALAGDPERQPCAERTGCVHIMLDA